MGNRRVDKPKRQFKINHPLRTKLVRDMKIVTVTVAVLEVHGFVYLNTSDPAVDDLFEKFGVDIVNVIYKGVDIMPVLEAVGYMEDLEEACIRATNRLFEIKDS